MKKKIKTNPFFIAEVGQNHQGDLKLAREYVKTFASSGADAIKFQNRDIKYLFDEEAYNQPYDNRNAFASVYGKHRECLELDKLSLKILRDDCWSYGTKFMCTPFDEPSLEILNDLDVDIIKIASFDLGNLPLINLIGQTGKPCVISVGGGKFDQITSSVELLESHSVDLTILHCVSEYPCSFDRLGLVNIKKLKSTFPNCKVGLSDHFNGILSGPIALMLGAEVFEKHVTMNRSWKGTDHSFALECDGFKKFVRDIKRVPLMFSPKDENEIGTEYVFRKLGKSITAKFDLSAGDILDYNNLSGKIFKICFIPVRESNQIIGKKLNVPVSKGAPICYEHIS